MYKEIIALGLMSKVGAVKIKKIIEYAGSVENIFGYSFQELCQIPGIGEQAAAEIRGFTEWDKVDEILSISKRFGYSLLAITDKAYPKKLAELYDSPPILWYVGNVDLLNQQNMAVVGTRRMSAYAAKEVGRFTKAFVEQKLNIVSGLALGIDTLAHKVCIEHSGKTIAVLGSGFNKIYPAINKSLARQIVDSGGCLLSEYAPSIKAEASHFPTRNRIVSGLSLGVLMVESGMKGGSMITAARALDQNREVFAIPHPNGVQNGEGGNHLIKKSAAKLVQNPIDVFEEIGIHVSSESTNDNNEQYTEASWVVHDKKEPFSPNKKTILEACENKRQSIDDLFEATNLAYVVLQQILFELELEGFIKQFPGAFFKSQ